MTSVLGVAPSPATNGVTGLRIAFVHNRYRSAQPSGENTAVEFEMDLLRDAGCEVSIYERSSDEIAAFSTFEKAKLPCRVVWSREDQNDLGAFLERTAPEIVHVHNTFPLISPAVFSEVAARRLPVVATLHNFRTTCVNAQLFRDGEPCELCVGRGPWRGVLHRCYRRSAAASMPLAASIAFHRLRGTWTYDVSRFIALAQFARDRFVTSGIPGDRIDVIPNFVPRPAERRKGPGDYFLFLGRITVEKGLDLLASSWSREMGQLVVVGDGPSRDSAQRAFGRSGDSVTFLGGQPHDRSMEILTKARALIVPSRVYEGSPMVVAEAYARGVPVIGPRHGAFAEYIEDDRTGRLFTPGDAGHLSECINAFESPNPAMRMGEGALDRFEQTFAPEQHRRSLLETYHRAMGDGADMRVRTPDEGGHA